MSFRWMRPVTTAVLVAVLALTVGGCGPGDGGGGDGSKGEQSTAATHKPRTWVLLLDLSGSTKGSRDYYQQMYQQINNQLSYGDYLVVLEIGENSEFNSLRLQEQAMPVAYEPQGNSEWAREKDLELWLEENPVEPAREKLLSAEVTDAILNAQTKGSDILGALRLAHESLVLGDREQRLIVMSDMMNASEDLDMYKPPFKDGKFDADAWLQKSKDAGKIPDFSKAKVMVVGASAGSQAQFDQAKDFWVGTYFPGAGVADLKYETHVPLEMLTTW